MDTAWERAVKAGDVDGVRRLLQAGTDVDARDRHGQTGLMLAAHRGHREVVDVLVAAGAALDLTAKFNLSALMLSIVAGHAVIARRLAQAGADLTIAGTGAPGFLGKTAYDLAIARDMVELSADLRPR